MVDESKNKVNDVSLESNLKMQDNTLKRKVNRKFNFRLVMTFVFLCVVVASTQSSIYLPVFSDYFSPSVNNTTVVEEVFVDDKPYVVSMTHTITEDSVEKILYLTVNMNENFKNYESIYVEYINTAGGVKAGYSIVPKSMIAESHPTFVRTKPFDSSKFKINIYCSSSHPEKLTYTDKFEQDEIIYYLIYTHKETIEV